MKNISILSDGFAEKCKEIAQILAKKPRTLVLCHKNPDGDALGSLSAVSLLLELQGIAHTPACIDPIPADFSFLEFAEDVISEFDEEEYDLVIFLDCGAHYLTGYHEEKPHLFEKNSKKIKSINIDHHPSNDKWADVNVVETKMASTTQILWHMCQEMKQEISPDMATSLLTGMYTDTGSFMHQNTTPDALNVAGELLKRGGNVNLIAENIFQHYEYKKLKLWGKILENVSLTDDGAAIVGVHEDDYKAFGCQRTDLAGVIDFISAMPEADYSVVLSEDGKGNVKASLRTRKDDVDVNALAKKFGGGGHVKASGFTIPKGKLKKEVKWKIVSEET